MLGKTLVHGLAAAILIGSAAAVYAQAKDNGSLSPDAPVPVVAGKADDRAEAKVSNGYLRPDERRRVGADDRERRGESERHHDRRDRHHDEDDD